MSPRVPSRVDVTLADGLATVTLNAPERLNAVDTTMLDDLADAIERLASDGAVRAIALTGAGRGFCSGAALTAAEAASDDAASDDPASDDPASDDAGSDDAGSSAPSPAVDTSTLVAAARAVRAITSAPKPVVALVNGIAAGVGCSLALACDYALARSSASFMLAFTKIGLMPDGGATALVAASIGRARALRMALTAEKVPATTACEWGLIAEVVTDEMYDERAAALLAHLSSGATLAYAETKAAVNAAVLPDLAGTLERETAGQARLFVTSDFAEGRDAFLTKRPARFTGLG